MRINSFVLYEKQLGNKEGRLLGIDSLSRKAHLVTVDIRHPLPVAVGAERITRKQRK